MRRNVRALVGVLAVLLVFFLVVHDVYSIGIYMNPTCGGGPGVTVTVLVQYNTASVVSVTVASTWGSGWESFSTTCSGYTPGEESCEYTGMGDSGGFAVDAWDTWPEIVSSTYTVDCPAVGGVLEPVRKLVILFPYVALVALMAAIVIARVRKRED